MLGLLVTPVEAPLSIYQEGSFITSSEKRIRAERVANLAQVSNTPL